jgi:hypothetical protein
MKITKSEKDLVLAIGEVGYGQLLRVDLQPGPALEEVPVTGKTRQLLETLRTEGIHYVDSLTIHQGTVTQIETSGTTHSFEYKKKLNL